VVRPGLSTSPVELSDFVRSRLAYFETPTRWWLRENPLPINATNKVLKSALRAGWPAEI
jgi:acyl-CoA synthetase (AMP-forming)/AMP-acid ligase II